VQALENFSKIALPFITLTLLVITLTSPALALTVTTDKDTYHQGETVIVSGTTLANSIVTIKLLNPEGTLVAIGQVQADSTGSYSYEIVLPSDMPTGNFIFGTYTVEVYSADEGVSKSKTFTIEAPPAVYAWVQYTPSSSEVTIDAEVSDGAVTVTVTFAEGLNVTDWGTVTQSGSQFIVDVDVYKWNGTEVPEVPDESRVHTYDLGTLSYGTYTFILKAWGSQVASESFEVPDLEPPTILGYGPNGTVSLTKPTIFVNYADNVGIDVDAVKLYLNNIDVTSGCNKTTTGLVYKPPSDLSNGTTYSVKAVVTDIYGNQVQKEWSFTVQIITQPQPQQPPAQPKKCLIATAAYGTELALPVQFLREFRDNYVLKTAGGSSFMEVFNAWYYSWSPYVAELETQNPLLRELVKNALKPLIAELTVAKAVYDAFSFNSELAVVLAGLVASFLIGLTYFAPIALTISAPVRKKLSAQKLNKTIAWLIAILAVFLTLHILALTASSAILKVSSASIVLTTVIIAAITPTALLKKLNLF